MSRARNVAFAHITGDIVAFPGDDCWYPPDLLHRIAAWFRENQHCDGLVGTFRDEGGPGIEPRHPHPTMLTPLTGGRAASVTIFLLRRAVGGVDGFCETLGLGAGTLWGAGEEVEYMHRILQAGYCIYYDPSFVVHHLKIS